MWLKQKKKLGNVKRDERKPTDFYIWKGTALSLGVLKPLDMTYERNLRFLYWWTVQCFHIDANVKSFSGDKEANEFVKYMFLLDTIRYSYTYILRRNAATDKDQRW
jgi:hypothetical protein